MENITRRNSKQRQLIIDTLQKYPIHPSAEKIYGILKPEHPELSLGTVYRNLNLLADMGIIQRVEMSLPQEHYDGNTASHYHMICDECGEIVDVFPSEHCGKLKCAAETENGDLLTEEYVLFRGICRDCRK